MLPPTSLMRTDKATPAVRGPREPPVGIHIVTLPLSIFFHPFEPDRQLDGPLPNRPIPAMLCFMPSV